MPQVMADVLLLVITVIWGTTFVLVKDAIASIKPFTFLAVRFFVGSVTLLLWLGLRRIRRLDHVKDKPPGTDGAADSRNVRMRDLIKGSVITGVTLFLAYATQTLGLLTVPAGKAAFITGLSVVMVPVGSAWLLRQVPEANTAAGVVLATLGLGLMSLTLPFRVEVGDMLIFLCAIGFAAHILLVGIHSKQADPAMFAVIQLLIVAAGSFVAALVLERPLVVPGNTWGAIVYTGVMATAVTVLVQSTVQKYTSASHAALIYSAEPVFAAFFGWIMLGEVLTPRETAGAILILAGMLVSEISPWRRRQPIGSRTAAEERR